MNQSNPYAPPSANVGAPAAYAPSPGSGSLSISQHGWEVVSSMARWMRIVSVFLYVFAGFLLLGAVGALLAGLNSAQGPMGQFAGPIGGGVMVVAGIVLIFAATWLRRAAYHFYQGVIDNAEQPLAHGFANLRLYLIIYGIAGIAGLLLNVAQLVFLAR